MATTDLDRTFRSHVGHKPWFFVPDTGEPGGSAVLIDPVGAETPADLTQTTSGEGSSLGPRVGFRVPYVFSAPGPYVFRITQGDEVIDYQIDVQERRRIVTKPDGKKVLVTGGDEGVPEEDQT